MQFFLFIYFRSFFLFPFPCLSGTFERQLSEAGDLFHRRCSEAPQTFSREKNCECLGKCRGSERVTEATRCMAEGTDSGQGGAGDRVEASHDHMIKINIRNKLATYRKISQQRVRREYEEDVHKTMSY